MKIYKYELKPDLSTELHIEKYARLLSCQVQRGVICLWYLVDEYEKTEKRTFYRVGTGKRFDASNSVYIGTVQQEPYVWHIWEGKQDED